MIQRRSLSLAVLALSGAAILAGPALAQNLDAIKTRQELMKDNGKAAKEAGAILKGEAEFSADKATEIFTRMHDIAVKFGDVVEDEILKELDINRGSGKVSAADGDITDDHLVECLQCQSHGIGICIEVNGGGRFD